MTKKEIAEILAIMQSNYPDDFKGMSDAAMNGKINLWLMQFRDDQYSDVLAAVMAHIATDTNRFMPPVGVIKAKLAEIRQPETMTPHEAWMRISEALRNGIYGAQKEFDALPPLLQKMVGSPTQLKEWAMMDAEVVQSVVASNFRRSYEVRAAKEREYLSLPSNVRQAVEQIAAGMKQMPALTEGEVL